MPLLFISWKKYCQLVPLQLWQNVFEDTFSEYHRLSTALASQQDVSGATAVWREYLKHVQSFLGDPVPSGDYGALSEQHKLCGVHEKILKNHRSLILNR